VGWWKCTFDPRAARKHSIPRQRLLELTRSPVQAGANRCVDLFGVFAIAGDDS
jgi:hypothetical protein